jgi:predicted DCC family thiol-disulfide oxidoreductase YuxK
MEKLSPSQDCIVFFDGVCHLCNGFVDALISRDTEHRLKFAPLQGETAQRLLAAADRLELQTVIYCEAGQIYKRSNAILKIAHKMGGIYYLLMVGWLLPKGLRDLLYNFIAKQRYAWFGQREFCRRPLPEEQPYLLP